MAKQRMTGCTRKETFCQVCGYRACMEGGSLRSAAVLDAIDKAASAEWGDTICNRRRANRIVAPPNQGEGQ